MGGAFFLEWPWKVCFSHSRLGPKVEIAKLWYGIICYNIQSLLPYVEIGVAQPRPFSKIEFREKSSASKYYWRPPSHWRPPWTSRWRPPDMRDPNPFIGNLGVSNEKFGVFNKNMGSPMKSLWSPIKICGSPTRIWGCTTILQWVSPMKGGLQWDSIVLKCWWFFLRLP